ncbi:hypothetical protein I317_06936 [Kwoniella heveanensis CBS 569]|nr:hypothetical protein I317_06936 [Kwoniella heveanensis CBS 569]
MALETDDSAVEPERMLIGCYAETHGAKTYEKGGHLDIHPDNASAYHSSTFTVPTVQTKQESLLATYSRCGLNEYGTPGSKMREPSRPQASHANISQRGRIPIVYMGKTKL